MKKSCTFLLCNLVLSVSVFSQVSLHTSAVPLVSPSDNVSFLHATFTSHEPVRIEECTIDFIDDRIFDYVDRLLLYQDSIVLPVLSDAHEFLFNPWTHYPGVYVGMADDTAVLFDYRLDTYRSYSQDLSVVLSCRVDYYNDPSIPDTVIVSDTLQSPVIVSGIVEPLPRTLEITLQNGEIHIMCHTYVGDVVIYDMFARQIAHVNTSSSISIPAGSYIVCAPEIGYRKQYNVW